MKRLAFGAAAAGGAAFALHRLAQKGRAMHAHCRDMMRTQSGAAATMNQAKETVQCG